jgi:hypothetical protein
LPRLSLSSEFFLLGYTRISLIPPSESGPKRENADSQTRIGVAFMHGSLQTSSVTSPPVVSEGTYGNVCLLISEAGRRFKGKDTCHDSEFRIANFELENNG